jgi:hypothetical protein
VLSSAHRPYVFNMLDHGIRHIGIGDHPTSAAQVPLVTLVAVRFCLLVTSKGVDLGAARKEVCAELSGTLALLPRLYKQKALTEEELNKFRNTTKEMNAWAGVCTEPMSLGTIHAFVRMHWVQWYVRIIGTNSLSLQTFLYLCEKRRLQASSDINDDNDDKRLIGVLLEDQRIAPYLLQDGRPKTVSQCIKALRNWCHLPTLDGRTLDDKYIRQLETSERLKGMSVVESISSARSMKSTYMYERIMNNNHRVTQDMYLYMSARLPVGERRNGLTDPTLLRRYLIWEMDPPSCFELEATLFKAVQITPEWEELRAASLLRLISKKSKWRSEVAIVIREALEAKLSRGCFVVNDPLQIALLKTALKVSGYEESLKAALISAVQCTPGWLDSFADCLLESTMPKWRKLFCTIEIERLSRSLHVISGACMEYLVPMNGERKNKTKTQNQVVGELFGSFMADARPILEKAYGESCMHSTRLR